MIVVTVHNSSGVNLCLKQYQNRAQAIVDTLFPPGVPLSSSTGSQLDTLVVELSKEMIDDYPASDPRWAESLPSGTSM
jgi:nuclear pore complex protein Nup133